MMRKEYKIKFNNCKHDRELHVDVEDCGGKAAGNGIFQCQNCGTFVTMIEKCALDQLYAQNKSLKVQERNVKTGMWANIISSFILIVAFLTLLFGNKILQYFMK